MQSQASSSSAGGKPERLYVGNLAPTVDEYTLIQVLQKYGKITKLDFIFHKTGPMKGKPRGYAFIEYGHKDEALKAMSKLHGRLLRGRNLVVTHANSAPSTDTMLHANKSRRPDPSKTTTLSLLKTSKKPQSAAAQIAAMEAKLASLASRKPADEDYVPGQRYATSLGSASPALLASGSASPARPGQAIGEEAAALAAADLEKEFMAEIAPHLESGSSAPIPAEEAEKSMRGELRDELGEGPVPNPPRQSSASTGAMSDAFKRGLATLPPKPGS